MAFKPAGVLYSLHSGIADVEVALRDRKVQRSDALLRDVQSLIVKEGTGEFSWCF